MSDNRSLPNQSFILPQFENLEQRLLLTTLHAGHFFIYEGSDGHNVRVSLAGDPGTSVELFGYDGQNPDQRFVNPHTGNGQAYGLVDLVGLMDGSTPVNWPDGSPVLNAGNWTTWAAPTLENDTTTPPTAYVPTVRGAKNEIYAIYFSNANADTVLTITELTGTEPTGEGWTTAVEGFTGGTQPWLFDTYVSGTLTHITSPASSGDVVVGAQCNWIVTTDNPPSITYDSYWAVQETDFTVHAAARGVYPGGYLHAGITIPPGTTVGKIIIGGTLAGTLGGNAHVTGGATTIDNGGDVGTLEMGFLWGSVRVAQNLGDVILRQGGGGIPHSTGSGYYSPTNSQGQQDSYVTAGYTIQSVNTLGNTLYSSIDVANLPDPSATPPSNIVQEFEVPVPPDQSADVTNADWIAGEINDLDDNSQGNAQFLAGMGDTSDPFYVYGDLADEGSTFTYTAGVSKFGTEITNMQSDWYGMPLYAGQTVTIDGIIGLNSTAPGDWSDPSNSFLDYPMAVHLYDSSGRMMDTLGYASLDPNGLGPGSTTQAPMIFTAPAAGVYYVVVIAGYVSTTEWYGQPYTLKITDGPAASLGAVHVTGDLVGNITVHNAGTIGAVAVSGNTAGSTTQVLGVDKFGGGIIAYQAGTISTLYDPRGSASILSDGNIGSISSIGIGYISSTDTPGDIWATITAGDDGGVYNQDAYIQDIYAVGNVGYTTSISASGSIGVITVAGSFYPLSLAVNTDGFGTPGKVDLIDVTGDWGSLVYRAVPALTHGLGGDFGYIRVGGIIYVDYGGITAPITATQVTDGSSRTLKDDGGGLVTITPTSTPVLDATGKPVIDPVTHKPMMTPSTYSYSIIGVDDAVNPGVGVGGAIANLTINGTATLANRGVVEIGELDVTSATVNSKMTINGSGALGIYYANVDYSNATGVTSFTDSTAGDLVSGSFGAIGSIAISGNIGPKTGSVSEWLHGSQTAPVSADTSTEPQYGWFNGTINGLDVTGNLGSLKVGGSLGDLRVSGTLGPVVVDSDKKTAGGGWDGVLGVVWSNTSIASIDVGDGLAGAGDSDVPEAGIFSSGTIGKVSVSGARYVINGVVFHELDGVILAKGGWDPTNLTGPDTIGQVIGTKGAVCSAQIGAINLDAFRIMDRRFVVFGDVGTVSFSGKGAEIDGAYIEGQVVRTVTASTDSDGIDYTSIIGNAAPAGINAVGQVLAGGPGLQNSSISTNGGNIGVVKTTVKTGGITGNTFTSTDGLVSLSSRDIDTNDFHITGTIASIQASGEMSGNTLRSGALMTVGDKGDFSGNTFVVAGVVNAITIGGQFANSTLDTQGPTIADMRSLQVTGDISGTVVSAAHIGKIVSKKGSISAGIYTTGDAATSNVDLIQAANDVTGIIGVSGSLLRLTAGGEVGISSADNGGVSQRYYVCGSVGQVQIGGAKSGSGNLYADFSVAGGMSGLNVDGTLYGQINVGGNLGKVVIGGNLGGLVDDNGDGIPETLRGMLSVYGGLTSLTLGAGGDILSDLTIGDTIGSIILKGGFIRGAVESRYGSIGTIQLTGGGVADTSTIQANSLGKMTTKGSTIAGDIILRDGSLGSMTVNGGSLSANITVQNGTIDLLSLTGAGTTAGKTISASAGIGSVKVSKGNMVADLLSRRDIGTVTITGGELDGDIWAETGIGTIKVSGAIRGVPGAPLAIRSGGTIGSITAGSMDNALVSSDRDIVKVAVSGTMDTTDVMAGFDVGPDKSIGGGDDTVHAGSVGSVTIGQMKDSVVSAGVGPGASGNFLLTGENTYAPGISVIGKMQVKSGYSGANGVLAETSIDPKYKTAASGVAGVTVFEQTPIYTITDMTAMGVFGPLAGGTNLSYTADGMTMTLTGAGVAKYDSASRTLAFEQTNSSSKLTIVRNSGTPVINIAGGDDAALGSLTVGPQVTADTLSVDGLVGTMVVYTIGANVDWTLPGGVNSASVGAPTTMDVTAGAIGSWSITGAYAAGTFSAGAVGGFTVNGGMDATLNVDSATSISVTGNLDGTVSSFGTVGTLSVGGTLSGNVNVYAGDLANVVVGAGLTGAVNNSQQILKDAGGNDVLYGGGQTASVVVGGGNFGGGSATSFRSARGIGSFRVSAGDFTGLLSSEGNIGGLSVAGLMSGKAWSELSVTSAAFGGMSGGLLAASNDVGAVSVAGDMLNSWVFAGFNPGDAGYDAADGGEAANLVIDAFVSNQSWLNANNRDAVYGGDIGSVTVTGAMTASTISAGVGPGVDGYCGTGDDFAYGAGNIGKVAVSGLISGSGNTNESYGVFAVSSLPVVTYEGGSPFSSNGNAVVNSYANVLPGPLTVTNVTTTSNSIVVSLNNLLNTSSLTSSSLILLGSADDTFTTTDNMDSLVNFSFDSLHQTITITLDSGTWTTQPVDKFFQLTLTDALQSNRGDKLDGEYTGTFPSGNGLPGGNFVYTLSSLTPSTTLITKAIVGTGTFTLTLNFGQKMDQTQNPAITFPTEDPTGTISRNLSASGWTSGTTYVAVYNVVDTGGEVANVDVDVSANDATGVARTADFVNVFSINTPTPVVSSVTPLPATIADPTVGTGTFTLTVVFGEAMDRTVIPTISFPVEDPSATITLNPGASGWSNATTYVASYNVADANTVLADIDVRVTGARDLSGTNQTVAGVFADKFSINTLNPTVVSVTPSAMPISDANVATGFTLTVVFSKPMDRTVAPTVSFPVEDPSATITFNAGASGWTNSTTYVAHYDVVDVDEVLENIDVQVTGAKDAAGNDQVVAGDFADKFSINTFTTNMIPASIVTITDATVGTGTFTLTFMFDKDMDTTVNPTITFPTEDPSGTITPSAAPGAWLDARTYVATYDVADIDTVLANVDVRVTGAKDAADNTLLGGTFVDDFSIDTVNPTVTSITPSSVTITDATVGTGTFTLTVVFSDSMNQSTAPLIAFPTPGEVPSATIQLNAGASHWANATTYVASYNVVDVGQYMTNIDVRVSNVKNLVGNTGAGTIANVFSVNTLGATVTPSPVTIADATVGVGTFTLTIAFADNMDQTVAPTVSFPTAGENPAGTITFNAGLSGWIPGTNTYVASYNVADINVNLPNVDVRVTGMKVLAGPVLTGGTFVDNFHVDTLNPTVSTVVPSLATIRHANVATGFSLTVVFSENMDEAVAPAITFPTAGEDPTATITPSAVPGVWLNGTTYVAYYDVADASNTAIANIDVKVAGAKDAAGNTVVAATFADKFSIDTVH